MIIKIKNKCKIKQKKWHFVVVVVGNAEPFEYFVQVIFFMILTGKFRTFWYRIINIYVFELKSNETLKKENRESKCASVYYNKCLYTENIQAFKHILWGCWWRGWRFVKYIIKCVCIIWLISSRQRTFSAIMKIQNE
jgi:hypothetical protein